MPQVIRAFLSTEPRQERANCSVDLRNGSRFGAAQTFFEFAVSHLNRVEVRRIFRQVPERRARLFDDFANAVTAVSSRNTSLAGSSSPCSRIQRRRARATSARSRSAACRLFFEGDAMSPKKPRKSTLAGSDPSLQQCRQRLL